VFPCTVRNIKKKKHITTKFSVKLGNNVTERHAMLQTVYENKILPQAQTTPGFKHFKEGRENVKDALSSEQPKMTSSRELVQQSVHFTCKRVLPDTYNDDMYYPEILKGLLALIKHVRVDLEH
jgi:hypothetical protein